MSKKLDKLFKEERLEERKETAEATSKEIALRMQECGMSQDVIAKCVNDPVEQVKLWLN